MNKQDKSSVANTKTLTIDSKTLTTEEERILRMRTGISVSPSAELESKLDGLNEDVKASVVARLALIQMEAIRAQSPDIQEGVDTVRRTRIVEALKLLATDD